MVTPARAAAALMLWARERCGVDCVGVLLPLLLEDPPLFPPRFAVLSRAERAPATEVATASAVDALQTRNRFTCPVRRWWLSTQYRCCPQQQRELVPCITLQTPARACHARLAQATPFLISVGGRLALACTPVPIKSAFRTLLLFNVLTLPLGTLRAGRWSSTEISKHWSVLLLHTLRQHTGAPSVRWNHARRRWQQ